MTHVQAGSIASSPTNEVLAFSDVRNQVALLHRDGVIQMIGDGNLADVTQIAWHPNGRLFASASVDRTIRLWDWLDGRAVAVLEGHTDRVLSIAFSSDGRLLFSKSSDETIRIWRTDTFRTIATVSEPTSSAWKTARIATHPTKPLLVTYGKGNREALLSEFDADELYGGATELPATVSYASAKVVLVGDSNVGKSCLALRLAGQAYEELGTTHGMRFWPVRPAMLDPESADAGRDREIILWDLGGQPEYQLVHQLFLAGTTLALILFDPTRPDGFEQAEGWNRRLERQLDGRASKRFLVAAKVDQYPDNLVDELAVNSLMSGCGFVAFFSTSALSGIGIPELGRAIYRSLDWDSLARTTRPELFEKVRREISRRTERSEVVLLLDHLVRSVEMSDSRVEFSTVDAVVDQLALQGVIVRTKLDSGDEALLLQIGFLEEYAGSIIVAAKKNPRGVPAIEERMLLSSTMIFPGLSTRLPRDQERLVIECAVQLLLQHGICLKHEGLLIFPSLFKPAEKGATTALPHSVSLYYDFAGATSNIYSSLVAQLALSEQFGHVRLWEDRAEFSGPGKPTCGVRQVGYGTGLAHLDVYFAEAAGDEVRDLFTVYVEQHLNRHGLQVTEIIEITCVCGHRFQEQSVRHRLARGLNDIVCSDCETRTKITEGAERARRERPDVERKLLALKTIIGSKSRRVISSWQKTARRRKGKDDDSIVRMLHLSDLHFAAETDVTAALQPLLVDLTNDKNGLGVQRLDALIISGDITNRATEAEFEVGRQFISKLLQRVELSPERCVVVPGNHDVDWDEMVYDWRPKRNEDGRRRPGAFVEEGKLVGIRSTERYPNRFRRFSSSLYHPIFQQEYPLQFELQATSVMLPDEQVQVLALNSAWETDEFFPRRSGIHPGAIARGIESADEQLKTGNVSPDEVLRIAVWHHPVTGNEKIEDDGFVESLRRSGFSLCVHGHVHETRQDVLGYLHRAKIHVAGAGSFGASAIERPESTPRLYNLIDFDRNSRVVRVHTRSRRTVGSPWEGWAVWPATRAKNAKKTYYELRL